MGAMARYIDGLSGDARDRLIQAQTWIAHALVDGYGGGCLRGHAEGLASLGKTMDELREWHRRDPAGLNAARDITAAEWFFRFPIHAHVGRANPADAFNAAVDRFGMERIVRAIKQRAAKGHYPSLSIACAQSERAEKVRV